ncbi:sulfotransferase [Deltaproteobacteria bacterium]|nr:sulfotransferase [Deltaproteobacteria bacterium]
MSRNQVLSSGDHNYRDIFSTILRLYAEKKGKKRWGEKTPTHYAHIKQLLEWYPESRIVYMVRDPRAVVASRLTMSKKYPLSWWYSRTVDDIATQWQDSIDILDRWTNDYRIHFILYEKLVQETLKELKRLCDFIGEEYSYSMMSYIEVADDLVGKEPWKETVAKPITVESVEKWQSQLLPRQVAIIEYLANRGIRKYQYREFGKTLGLFHKLWLNTVNSIRRFKRVLLKTESILKRIDIRAGA